MAIVAAVVILVIVIAVAYLAFIPR